MPDRTAQEVAESLRRLSSGGAHSAEEWCQWYAALGQPAQGAGPQRVSEEQYAKMDAASRLDYARGFPQTLEHGRRK